MRQPTTKAAALVATAVATCVSLTATPAQAAGSFHGCPSGAVCIYNGAGVDSGIESGAIYYSYGAHNLHGQYGNHAVVNNQTDNAWLTFCGGYNGTGEWFMSEAPNTALLRISPASCS